MAPYVAALVENGSKKYLGDIRFDGCLFWLEIDYSQRKMTIQGDSGFSGGKERK